MFTVAADYPLAEAILTVLWIFALVIFFWLLITVFADLWRDHDLSGWAKAAWVIFVIALPFLGILVYLIARGQGMAQRSLAEAKHQQELWQQAVRDAASGDGGSAEELSKLADLRDKGVITAEEFEAQKRKILS